MTTNTDIAPDGALGPTQILDNGDQFYITDGIAAALVFCRMIVYSPEDGQNARVYRLREGVTIEDVKAAIV